MMQRGLAGEEVNGAKLAKFGACKYSVRGGRTCIVGLLMTPAQRAWAVENDLNDHDISDVHLAVGDDNIVLLQLPLNDLEQLQNLFDNHTRAELEAHIDELLQAH